MTSTGLTRIPRSTFSTLSADSQVAHNPGCETQARHNSCPLDPSQTVRFASQPRDLLTDPSNAEGWAEATWQTKAPGKKNPGTPTGNYTVETRGITAAGYHWDRVTTNTTFTIQ